MMVFTCVYFSISYSRNCPERILLIYDELRNYLNQVSSPETVQIFDNAVDVLEKYGVPDYMSMFEDVVFNDPNASDVANVDALQLNLMTCINHLLVIQGLHTSEVATASDVIAIADAMYMLVDYEDRDALASILNGEFPDHEMAGELLALLLPQTVEEVMAMLESVDDTFGETFTLRLTQKDVGADSDALAAVDKQVKAYAKFKSFLGQTSIYPDQFFQHVPAIGLEFSSYLSLYQSETQGTDLSAKPVADVASELVGMALLSKEGVDNPLIVVRKHLVELFPDMSVSTRVDVAVSKLIVGLNHAQA